MANNVLHAIECDCQECLDKWVKVEENASPSKCLCLHALGGYETYLIDDNTIGVRPIWFDANKNPPKYVNAVLVTDGLNVGYAMWNPELLKWVCVHAP